VRQDRRNLLIGLGAAPLALAAGMPAVDAQTAPALGQIPDVPDPANFQAGDLVWPKRKGSIVPRTRSLAPGAAPDQESRAWDAARRQLLADPAASGLSPDVAERLRSMNYADFTRVYYSATAEEAPRSAPPPRSRGLLLGVQQPISVGHVGLIELSPGGTPYVIEATPINPDGSSAGVIRTVYSEWLKRYTRIQVWQGRLSSLAAEARWRIVEVARSQLGKPYDFFNFDLSDDRGFYCSKLVWFCAWRGAQIAPDDNPNPYRGNRFPPWFAPKTLLNSRRVQLVHNPGEY
jgi:cell wall-associated NlpC family hydrolase